VPVPQPHPFTAAGSRLVEGVLDLAPTLHAAVAHGAPESPVVWLPGKPHAPLASPELIRTEAATGGTKRAPGLWPFEVTSIRLSPSAGLDVALALGGVGSPEIHAGASVSAFAALAVLALEIVAAGRVLPDLRRGADGYEAVWEPLLNGEDDGRARTVAEALPPVCRALTAEGVPPEAIVQRALRALVNSACRDSLAAARPAPIRLPRGGGDLPPAALES
jgi:hypothetical protein